MKAFLKVGLVAVMALALIVTGSSFLAGNADAATSSDVKVVTVKGEGKITVTPDMGTIRIGVKTENVDAAVAQQENAEQMTKVIEAIKALGIEAKDIQTSGYSLYQSYKYYDDGKEEQLYFANNTVTVVVRDLTKMSSIIDQATASGSNVINGITYASSKADEYYNDALKLAMENAKGKGQAIMGTFGRTLGSPYSVTETSYGGSFERNMSAEAVMFDAKAMNATPVESGEITISASVSVEYDY